MVSGPTRILHWETPAYKHTKKSADWFWVVGILATMLIVLAVVFQSVVFAFFLFIATILVMVYAVRTPEDLTIEINDHGIQIEDSHYHFSDIDAFWIVQNNNETKLLFHSETTRPEVMSVIINADVDPYEVKDLLSEFLPEIAMEEPLITTFLEKYGF